jgi:hypothetical protein
MDIKEQIEKAVEKIQKDSALQAQFKKEPLKAVETALGIKLPDEAVEKITAGVKAKLSADDLSGAVDKLKKLF